jgi:hypothetical protein
MKDAYDMIFHLLSEGIAVTAEDVVYDEYESLNLFSPYSFILTGSDNDYSYVIDNKAVMEYASDFFYKGN